jgi:hypothetical protein
MGRWGRGERGKRKSEVGSRKSEVRTGGVEIWGGRFGFVVLGSKRRLAAELPDEQRDAETDAPPTERREFPLTEPF